MIKIKLFIFFTWLLNLSCPIYTQEEFITDFSLKFSVLYFLPLEESKPVKIKILIDEKEVVNKIFSLDRRDKKLKETTYGNQGTEIYLRLDKNKIHKIKAIDVKNNIIFETIFDMAKDGNYSSLNYNFFPKSHPHYPNKGFDFFIHKHRFMEE